ncbi:flagellar brake protein [Paenibacillus kobensis]|uniref:flagellar brake protein n=1 Tax=Paenibacillus kobensis TaxID=59841 RepID=UPI000FDB28D1|nr:flagellar brake domain-containing protein [Paenibacillus kobensis]
MLPKINQTLQYYVVSTVDEEAEGKFDCKSRIADDRNDELYMEWPLQESTGRLKRLSLGDEISAFYITEDGVKHFFNSYVTGFIEDNIRLVRIQKPDPASITKTQRRHFLRVDSMLEIAVLTPLGDRFNALTEDVGGGGISFTNDGSVPLEVGQTLECWLLLPYKNGTIEHSFFKGEIVRIVEHATGRNHVMLMFVGIGDYERQKIIRYCFERQLEFRNR